MRSDPYPLDVVLGERQQWIIPVYQRHYEWETGQEQQIPKLWEELHDKAIERLEDRTLFPHYFGAVIFSEPTNQAFGTVRQRLLVDGQQRITTFQVTVAALREVAREHDISRVIDVADSYLYNEQSNSMIEPDRERFKLWPSRFDRSLFQNIVEHHPNKIRSLQSSYFYKNGKLIKGRAPKLLRAYWYLYEQIRDFVSEQVDEGRSTDKIFDALLAGFLHGFQVVVIQLDSNDDAQAIFASLNGLGKPLSPFDLIRNYVFHRAQHTGEDYQKLFDDRWQHFEQPFWVAEVRQGRLKRARADHLMAHVVVAETAREINVSKLAAEYQHYAREKNFTTVAEELDTLLGYSSTYRAMDERKKGEPFSRIANVLQIWDMSAFHPFILWVNAQPISEKEKSNICQMVESYIVRRELCGLTTKNYNKVVTSIIRHARAREDVLEAVHEHLFDLGGEASKFPTDIEVEQAIDRRDVYNQISRARLRYILQQTEYAKRNKFDETTVLVGALTIEHVMPQAWAKYWPLPNGRIAPCESRLLAAYKGYELDEETKTLMDERQAVVNTLGNLTLITGSLNPSIGNSSWETKNHG